ncbi:hypothetical protein HPB51_012371 [Rhipicephalus microplus]|uniref:HTH CENPB-type domain-containing protein n=1 Tax=Rhipicephalus microplus TaxID=6941 RepID=A0A9J6DG84_RHIMP|nr:hypothetical protein HPB51_012371 [Rhipicephalus microplus]
MPKLGQKHPVLKIEEKLDITRAIESGTKRSALASEKDLPLTTVCGISNSREKLLGSAAAAAKRCRLRGSAFSDVEEALVKWLKAARSKNLPISGPLLVEKALVFASQLNHDNFVCSNDWQARFKARHGITTRTVLGEGAAADVDGAEQWQNETQTAMCRHLSPDMSDKAVVASVVEVSPNDRDEDDMESDNTGDPSPTVAEAAHCVSVMRVFAEKRGLAEKLAHSISEFEAAVVAARPPCRQMKITDFVTRS